MIDGIPASVSVASSIACTSLLFFAYSLRYTAEHMPIGSTKMSVIRIIYTVLRIFGKTPTVSCIKLGFEVKNFGVIYLAPR